MQKYYTKFLQQNKILQNTLHVALNYTMFE